MIAPARVAAYQASLAVSSGSLPLPSAIAASRQSLPDDRDRSLAASIATGVQRFRAALDPLGDARPDWDILARVGRALGAGDPVFAAERAEQVFTALAAARPPFAGMTYRALGDAGRVVSA